VEGDYHIDVKQSLPTLLNNETNFNSNVHSCMISVDQKHKGYQPLEDVVEDLGEFVLCFFSTSLNSLASEHSYVHGDINCMISIYHAHIDVYMDVDIWTNDVVSIRVIKMGLPEKAQTMGWLGLLKLSPELN